MAFIGQLKNNRRCSVALKRGGKARVILTGQVVDVKRVSDYGMSMVSFRSGDEYLISNKFLQAVYAPG